MPKRYYYLYRLHLSEEFEDPQSWSEADVQTINEHAEFLDRRGQEGHLVLAGRTDYAPGHPGLIGIALICAASLEEANKLMADDPAVVAGIQKAQVHPFRMAIAHFENLEFS